MTDSDRVAISGIALVVWASVGAIRGLVVGAPVPVVLGVALILFVIVTELATSSVLRSGRRPSDRTLRTLELVERVFEVRWVRRGFVALGALTVFESVVRGIASVVDGDWWTCVFYVVTGATWVVLLWLVLLWPPFESHLAPSNSAADDRE